MTTRLDAMLERMPPPFGIDPGTVLHDLLAVVDVALRMVDEDRERVQRSHWVDTATDRDDLARLGALFDVPPAPWEPATIYRARLSGTIGGRLRGSVSLGQLDRVLAAILDAAGLALRTRYLELGPEQPGRTRVPTTEFPTRTCRVPALTGAGALVQPLTTVEAVNRGTDPTPLHAIVRGVPGGRTAMPVLVSRTTGRVLGWRGIVPAGQELALIAHGDEVGARLDGRPVDDRLFSAAGLPVAADGSPAVVPPVDGVPRPLLLERGGNALWFGTLARYDDPGLDAAAFLVADLELAQGRWRGGSGGPAGATGAEPGGAAGFGSALFWQQPAAALDLWWVERRPATFRVDLPAGVVRRVAGARPDPEADHVALLALLDETVDRLRAAAIDGWVEAVRLRDTQPAADRLRVLPALVQDGSAGQDRVIATDARFDVTPREESRWG